MAVDRRGENQKPSNTGKSFRKAKDPFDFDAPRFADFTRRKYRQTKKLLDQIVLKQKVEDNEDNSHGNWDGPLSTGSSELSEGHWFAQAHSSHEPTSPLTPAGPLLSPGALLEDDTGMVLAEPETPASPTARPKYKGTPCITGLSSDYACMSPNVSMVRPGGLRSKPGRVLSRPVASSSLSRSCAMSEGYASERSPSGLKRGSPAAGCSDADELMGLSLESRRTPLAANVTPRMATSPISRFMLEHNRSEAKRSSPMKRSSPGPSSRLLLSEDTWTDGRISSLPSLEGWLASSSRIDSPPQIHLPSEGPSPMKVDECPPVEKPAPTGIRKLGMAARAARVQIPSTSAEPSQAPSPTIKRIRTDEHNFTAAAPHDRPQVAPIQKKGGTVKIEDLKKILAEHNQRLRPRKR